MTKFVRVELENGARATVAEAAAEAAGIEPLDPEQYPATDNRGRPLPAEFPEKKKDSVKPSTRGAAADNNPPAGS